MKWRVREASLGGVVSCPARQSQIWTFWVYVPHLQSCGWLYPKSQVLCCADFQTPRKRKGLGWGEGVGEGKGEERLKGISYLEIEYVAQRAIADPLQDPRRCLFSTNRSYAWGYSLNYCVWNLAPMSSQDGLAWKGEIKVNS